MKKVFFSTMLVIVFCVCPLRAQSIDADSTLVSEEAQISTSEQVNTSSSEASTKKAPEFKKDNYEDIANLLRQFNATALANQSTTTDDYANVFFPIEGKSKFMQHHHVTQRLEISMLFGKDRIDDVAGEASSSFNDTQNGNDLSQYDNKSNFGLNIGYSLVFIPGYIEGDKLRINKLGFGYSVGLIASFDKQDYYGVTSDLMLKLGAETGNCHKMGIGFDALIGTGTSCGNMYYFSSDITDESSITTDDETPSDVPTKDWAQPYSAWCFKYGGQL